MTIESNGDLHAALISFIEAAETEKSPEYRTLHISECTEVMLQRDDRVESLEPKATGTSQKRPSGLLAPSAKKVSLYGTPNHIARLCCSCSVIKAACFTGYKFGHHLVKMHQRRWNW